jgi:prophage regulatory protein
MRTAGSRMKPMHHRRATRSQDVHRTIAAMDDLFAYAERQPQQATDEELWSIKAVMAKTGLSRTSICAYVARGIFPRQRHLGPGRVAWLASEVQAWMSSRPF